jgi:carbon monoxide dehydrogenase subunit G
MTAVGPPPCATSIFPDAIAVLLDATAAKFSLPAEPIWPLAHASRYLPWGAIAPYTLLRLPPPQPTTSEDSMTITVNIDLGYEFDVKASTDEVFDVLADVPTSASHFPKVDKLVDLGGGAYRWEMAKIGIAQINLQTIYASKYVSNRAKGTVVWTPVKGEGNALVSGDWKISSKKNTTHIVLQIQGELTIPLPGLMKMVVAPVVENEFEKMIEQYIDNLTKRFGGEA